MVRGPGRDRMTAPKNSGKMGNPDWAGRDLTLGQPHPQRRAHGESCKVRTAVSVSRARKPSLLLVDNNVQTGRVLALRLKLAGYGSTTACNDSQAFGYPNSGQWEARVILVSTLCRHRPPR
jgi:hypothetical protein